MENKYVLEVICEDPELKKIYKEKWKNRNVEDSGLDLIFSENFNLKDTEIKKIGTGIKTRMLYGDKSVPFYILPRSSSYKTGLRLGNGTGVVDRGYRGELSLGLQFHKYIYENGKYFEFNGLKGISYFQICLPSLESFDYKFVNKFENDNSKRGENGFGSTGN